MTKVFQAANSLGLIIRGEKMQFATHRIHQTGLPGDGKFFLIWGMNNPYLVKLENAHQALFLRNL
jgi:hypothetical protein